jgi:cytochrome b561
MNAGLAIFVLSMLACYLRGKPSVDAARTIPAPGRVMARFIHNCLYFMLFALPITAYIGTGFDFPLLGLVNLPGFIRFEFLQTLVQQGLNQLMAAFIEPFAIFHRYTGAALILPLLLVGHITAGLLHRFFAARNYGES